MAEERRREPRAAVALNIRVAYGSLDEFVERQALSISKGGIFIRTRDLQPVGTPVAIDIRLQDGSRLVRGRGVIAHATPPSAPGEPRRAPGIGVQFTELDEESRALVERIVASHGAVAAPAPAAAGQDVDLADVAEPPAAPAPPAPARPAGARRRVLGIDLGTTNSCVAVSEDGRARLLVSRQGHRTMPSVVAFDAQGRQLVGQLARQQMVINPANTIYGAKRLVGRPFASPTVQACRDRFHYEIVEGEGGAAAVRVAGRDFSLQQISAFVLAEVRAVASEALGEEVTRAVVTVPAYYNDLQRSAVREAGRLAGLEVERIVNEPTAAALAFGHGRALARRVLVYDLGGGTFDASLLEIEGDVYEVVSTGGDTFLGGVDFDAQLVDHLAAAFERRHGTRVPEDRVAWQRLREAAEEVKVALSARERATASVRYLCTGPAGEPLDLEVEVTRAELEELTGHLVERTIEVCREVIADRGFGPEAVDEVLLVGGQSRMPLVARRIREVFGRDPSRGVHPDEAVALGAALLADAEGRIDSVVLIDVLAMGIGVGLPGGRMSTVLPRNTRLPAKRSYELATVKDGQTELELAVFQGDSQKVSECDYLGTVVLSGLEPAPRGAVRIAVEFSLGVEGILSVSAREVATGRSAEARLATLDTPESLREKLQIPEPPSPPRGARPLAAERRPPAAAPGAETARAAAVADAAERGKGILGRLFGRRA
jgi:molecular chaperone DnaK